MYKRENEVIQTNIFNRFKELYLDFPVGESNPQESPDFIVKTILGETIFAVAGLLKKQHATVES